MKNKLLLFCFIVFISCQSVSSINLPTEPKRPPLIEKVDNKSLENNLKEMIRYSLDWEKWAVRVKKIIKNLKISS